MAEVCAWHKATECLEKTGVLVLQQSMSAPVDREEFDQALAAATSVLGTAASVTFSTELGTFCTTSALLSWLEANTGAMREHTRELYGPGPGSSRSKRNAASRPTVTREGTRRQR